MVNQLALLTQPAINLEHTPVLVPPSQLLDPAAEHFISLLDDRWFC
nr:hypothetical protein [Fibrella forsythiae]